MKRFGRLIGVKPDRKDDYIDIHRAVWPEVLQTIHDCNIRNYSIFMYGDFLFAYFEYVGEDFEADMQKMAVDPKTQEWWKHTDPMQQPVERRREAEWWAEMEEIFYTP